jgi:hypothetical protein
MIVNETPVHTTGQRVREIPAKWQDRYSSRGQSAGHPDLCNGSADQLHRTLLLKRVMMRHSASPAGARLRLSV